MGFIALGTAMFGNDGARRVKTESDIFCSCGKDGALSENGVGHISQMVHILLISSHWKLNMWKMRMKIECDIECIKAARHQMNNLTEYGNYGVEII